MKHDPIKSEDAAPVILGTNVAVCVLLALVVGIGSCVADNFDERTYKENMVKAGVDPIKLACAHEIQIGGLTSSDQTACKEFVNGKR